MGDFTPSWFVTEPNDFKGLYKAADTLEKNKVQQAAAQERKDANRLAGVKFIEANYDPKEYLTGSIMDAEIGKRLNALKDKAYSMFNAGVDLGNVNAALMPEVSNLNQYSAKAKAINDQKKMAMAYAKQAGGIDMDKFAKAYDDEAWYNIDPTTGERKLKDINTIDPTTDYADAIIRNKPELVTNAQGFDDFFKARYQTPIVESKDIYRYTPAGGLTRNKAELKYADYLVPEPDVKNKNAIAGFVPKYELATDGAAPIVHDFKSEDGKTVSAPVRLLDKDVFEALPPKALNYIKGQVKLHLNEYKKAGGEDIPLNSVEAENVARALAYDELNSPARKGWTIKNVDILNKPAPKGRSGSGASSDEAIVNDIYGRVSDKTKGLDAGHALLMNQLASDEQNLIVDIAKKSGFESAAYDNMYLYKSPSGEIQLYQVDNNNQKTPKPQYLITTLPKVGLNLKVQPNTKAKAAVVEQGNIAPTKIYKINGKKYSHQQLLDMGYTKQQIDEAIKLGNIK